MNVFFYSFLFFLPAGIANMVPVFAAKIPFLREYNIPLDFGFTFRGKRILGNHKTIRGLVAGVVVGALFAVLENHFVHVYTHPWNMGFLLSFGALLGDSVKSFFKRQIGIASGKSWFPFDQADYIVGGILLSLFVVRLSFVVYITIFVIYFLLHIATTTLGFLLKLKDTAI